MLRRIQLLAIVLVLFTLLLAAPPAGGGAAAPANWTFEGCWTRSSGQPCRDVFRDQQGNHWVCRDCGTTGNPGPGKCSQISSGTLALGLWCS
ncbi:MAG TPA: hypothetical protein VFS76_13010 [Pyrinomonadaceae bacterium]|nr:hypothetical protein [Pyrinomonadaceae bacterium]